MKKLFLSLSCAFFLAICFAYADGPIQQDEGEPVSWQCEIEYDPGDSGGAKLPPAVDTTTRIEYVTGAWYGRTWWENPLDFWPKDIINNWGVECEYYSAIEEDDGIYWQTYCYPPFNFQMYYFEDIGDFIEVDYTGEYAEWWNLNLYVWIDAKKGWELIHRTGGSYYSFFVDVTDLVVDGNLIVLCFDPEQEIGQSITCDFSNLMVTYEE